MGYVSACSIQVFPYSKLQVTKMKLHHYVYFPTCSLSKISKQKPHKKVAVPSFPFNAGNFIIGLENKTQGFF